MQITHDILSASDIDYSNVEEICGYQLLMCKIFEREGGLCYPSRTNAAIREVQSQGKLWIKNVRGIIDGIVSGDSPALTLAAIPKLLGAYNFYHCICKGQSANDYIRGIRLKTVGLWAKGNKTISETSLVLELLKEINRDNRTLDLKYSTFALGIVGDWIKELKIYESFRNIPLAEAYARLCYLIDENLNAYLSNSEQSSEKAKWISTYSLTDSILDTLDAETLMAYIGFSNSVMIYMRQFDAIEDTYRHLIIKLADRDDIHPFFKESLAIDLAKHRTA